MDRGRRTGFFLGSTQPQRARQERVLQRVRVRLLLMPDAEVSLPKALAHFLLALAGGALLGVVLGLIFAGMWPAGA